MSTILHKPSCSKKTLTDLIELQERIKSFNRKNIKYLSNEELSKSILDVLLKNNHFEMPIKFFTYPKKTLFFRIRNIDQASIPIVQKWNMQQFWEAPSSCINKYGRLNKPHESLLYTSLYIDVCIHEMRLKKGDFYVLIFYKAKTDIKTVIICNDFTKEDFEGDPCTYSYYNTINTFLLNEFTKEVWEGTEHLYRASELIAKTYFDLPEEVQDCWTFPSIQSRDKQNVCFRPKKAKAKLQFSHAFVCQYNGNNEILNVEYIIKNFDKNGFAMPIMIGSEEQKKLFPEITLTQENKT